VADALAEAEGVRGARQSLDATVHRLLAAAAGLDADDPRRRDAQHRAINVALPLARSMAHRYQQRGEPLEDLIQVASLGVVRAVQGYDPARGSGFLAYAVPTILGELKRHFRDHVWTVRAPRKLQEIRTTITGAMSELAQELGR
jgi:RNA polymerase sigma-B factor